jgi:hypothetical protein
MGPRGAAQRDSAKRGRRLLTYWAVSGWGGHAVTGKQAASSKQQAASSKRQAEAEADSGRQRQAEAGRGGQRQQSERGRLDAAGASNE